MPLPIDAFLSDIVRAVRENDFVILTATPGAGKTTRLPPELLSAVSGKILVLQPRRMAAVAAATRVCDERGFSLGGAEVGYAVRFESRMSASTRLIFMTDALALRRLVDDPELSGVDLAVIDEFHERNLNQDLMLGCLRELRELGRSVKIMVMSATLETESLSRFLPGAAVFDIPGAVFPLDVRHSSSSLHMRTDFEFVERVVDTIQNATRGSGEVGDILCFLPGVGEITRVADRLQESGLNREVQILHGSLALTEQQRVLRRGTRPRVILSTNVAEASVTVDGVDTVVDCGLMKVMQTNFKTGFSQLETQRIALFNARQRAGRAARQKAGVCYRMWTPHEEVTQAVEPVPEVARTDLSQALLLLAHLGVSDFGSFTWFEHPPGPLLSMAKRSLRWLGALTEDFRLTDLGKRLIQFPLPPRWGALLVLGEESGVGALAARMAALLNERDILNDSRNAPTSRLECDLSLRLELLAEFSAGQSRHLRAQPVLDVVQQLRGMVNTGNARLDSSSKAAASGLGLKGANISAREDDGVTIRKLLLLSQRDRLCRRRGSGDRALMIGGRGVRLAAESQVRTSEFFIALHGVDLPGQPDTVISMACGMSKDFILQNLKEHVRVVEDIYFDEAKGQFYARRGRFIEDLPIDEPSLTPVDPSKVGDKLVDVLVDKWDWFVAQHEGLREWMSRLKFAAQHDSKFVLGEGASYGQPLSRDLMRQFIEMAAFGKTGIADVMSGDLVGMLESVLDRSIVKDLREQVPSHFVAETTFRHKIDYSEGHAAYVEVRLQELFGLNKHPKILNGKVPLAFRLLGPNFRPVQVTSDIPGFWKGAYVEVRKELRARYPKHSWPDDPLSAKPEAKGKRRS